MRIAAVLAATVVASGLAAGAARGEAAAAPGLTPFQMVRSLQLVQDRVAFGDHAALPIQRKLLEMIDDRFRKASAAEIMQPRNFRSMMVYAMSGGNPATLTSVLFRLHLDEEQSRMAGAVLAYLKGGSKFASSALKGIEPLKEPADIGAFLALVKGSVISLEDPQNALKLLDQARLLSPGTLVEEAALRRSVALAATVGDAPRFMRATNQYVRSYIRSPYASQFADAFVSGVVKLRDSLDLEIIAATVALMSPEQGKVLYLRIARRAAIDGLVALSQFASEKAKAIDVPSDSTVDPRIMLYTSLTSVTTEPADKLQEKIAGIDRNRLSSDDRELLDAVSAVSSEIVSSPKANPLASDPAVVEAPPDEHSNRPPPIAPKEEIKPAAPSTRHGALLPGKDSNRPPPTEQMAADAAASSQATSEADATVADGRKKLAEIDDLLAGAAE